PSPASFAHNAPPIANAPLSLHDALPICNLTFVPNTGSIAVGSFQFKVTDSLSNSLSSNTATMNIAITPSTGPITLDARQFSTIAHAGTVADPWPGTAIQRALMALPATGGTVTVADGVWKIDSLLQLDGVN